MQTALAIAVIAAFASVAAAVLSYRSSKSATEGAHRIASLNHRITALDAESAQFREDFRGFHAAMGSVKGLTDVGALLAATEILQANPRSSDALIQVTDTLRGATQAIVGGTAPRFRTAGGTAAPLSDESFLTLRREFREALAAIARERATLVAQRERASS
ncbi:hypothetical protein [Occultella kanbiaonis]|uniref:hypothetical protein n=1 Tax=Occultella kanbiaonis TaxID=2675754 RepID=UPI0012B7AC9F|nr:hypothetical protein [Occultella kanbiaonis]